MVEEGGPKYYKRNFWIKENSRYNAPHFRLEKAARVVNQLAGEGDCTLLDLGCGPGALGHALRANIRYYGIDIAIPVPAPNLLEADILQGPITFDHLRFDIILSQGLFEYLGEHQDQKLSEISCLLNDGGIFLVSYVNFEHRKSQTYWPYSNIQPVKNFRESLSHYFTIDRTFPTSMNWTHSEPGRPLTKAINMRLNMNIPFIGPKLAVEYFFLCSVPHAGRRQTVS